MKTKTLKDVMPSDFVSYGYEDIRAYKMKNPLQK